MMLLPCLLVLGGCTARTVQFRVVDSETCEPLEGVSVELVRLRYDYVFNAFANDQLRQEKTGADGVVIAELGSRSPVYQVTFQMKGYHKAFAHPNIDRRDKVKVTSPVTGFPPPGEGGKIISGAGPVEIPMHRGDRGGG